jgi:glycosyltransferase involved in cell wall biosynthesis
VTRPLLTIAIPTFNRAFYLQLSLLRLVADVRFVGPDLVEVLVCDNASTDETAQVVREAQGLGLAVHYHRWSDNIGSDANIAAAFNLAHGRYVLLLGDDDLLHAGTLAWLVARLQERKRGVLGLRPFGYDRDPDAEAPHVSAPDLDGLDGEALVLAAGPLITFISSCVINKELLGDLDARQFVGTNLVQVDLVLRAALAGEPNLMTQTYRIAAKRNNSGGYDFFDVFVARLGDILDSYAGRGLTEAGIRRYGDMLLTGFYPQYLLKARCAGVDLLSASQRLRARYGGRPVFALFVAPMLRLPRPLAIVWGCAALVVGRLMRGDFARGKAFMAARLRR